MKKISKYIKWGFVALLVLFIVDTTLNFDEACDSFMDGWNDARKTEITTEN